MDKNNLRSRQLNPCNPLFWKCRGYPQRPENWQDVLEEIGYYDDDDDYSDEDYYDSEASYYNDEDEESYESGGSSEENNLKSLENNPNNDAYWQLRGFSKRPVDWHERVYGTKQYVNAEQFYDDEDDSFSDESDDNSEEINLRDLESNPNNDAFWQLRGFDKRPDDWHGKIQKFLTAERVYGTKQHGG